MRYENHQPPEGINVSQEHPLKEFIQLVAGILAITLIVIALLSYFAGALARYIPFSYEQQMIEQFEILTLDESPKSKALQRLADRLVAHMELPEGMTITVHHQDDKMVNAFATLGGNVVILEGLIDNLETEQELAAVMAHEIAHIKLRHPIVATGKGVTLMTLAAVISGASASSAGDWLLGGSINVSMLQFSRAQESAADALAAQALFKEYGDISGAQGLFRRFAELEAESLSSKVTVEAFRSHPYSEDRWQALMKLAERHGWPTTGPATVLDLNSP